MSAFIVNDKTINRILTFISSYSPHGRNPFQEWFKELSLNLNHSNETDLQEIGEELLKLNLKSVNYRYNQRTKINSMDYKFKYEDCDIYQAFKHLSCLTYQSCEGKAEKTPLYKLLIKIENLLCSDIVYDSKEFKNAEWEANEEELNKLNWGEEE